MIKTPHLAISSRGLLCSLGVISSALLLSGCQDENYGFESQEIRNSVYLRNFEKTYGKIAEDQIWDFSSYNLSRLGLAGGPTSSADTRAAYTGGVNTTPSTNLPLATSGISGISDMTTDGYYKVQTGTLTWLNTNLKEQDNKRGKYPSFVLAKPDYNFAIIPIYQGQSGMSWELHLVDKSNNNDYKIWEKSQNIRYTANYNNGVEYMYNSRGTNDGGDILKWKSGGQIQVLDLKKAFSDYESGDLKLKFTLPANASLQGFICNVGWLKQDGDWKDNKGVVTDLANAVVQNDRIDINVSGGTTEVDLSGGIGKTWFNTGSLVLLITNINNCSISTWDDNRVHISSIFNKSKVVDLGKDGTIYDTSNLTGNTINKENVQAKPIVIDKDKIGGEMFLYLKITRLDADNPKYVSGLGVCQRSDEGQMVALPLDKPSNIGSNEYMIIGCEDASNLDENNGGKKSLSDWDYNDIVFLIVGQTQLPRIKETISKRYMIEDLGSTFDFDFNDIVLDVEQHKYKKYDGTYDENKTEQKAYLRHLSGTIPFKITVGNTPLGSKDQYEGRNLSSSPWRGDDPNGDGFDPATDNYYSDLIGCTVSGWNPDNNNIKVTSWPSLAGWEENKTQANKTDIIEKGTTYLFPQNGKYPYIIACDITTPWTKEMVNVPNSWFTTWNVPTPNPGIGGGSGSGSGTTGGNTPSDTPATQNNTLTFSFADASEAYSIIINNVEHVLNGSNSVPVSDIAAGTAINVKVKSANNDNIDYNVKYELTVNGNTKSGYGGQEINNVTNMPSAITTVTIKKLYQVMASIKNGPSQKWQSDDERHGKVQIVYNGQVVSNDVSNNNPQATAYLPKGASFTLVAIADQGYEFDGWYENRDNATRESAEMRYQVKRESNATTYFRSAIFKPATTNYHVVVTAKPSGWGQVKIGDGNFGATAEGYYASGTNLTLYAQANNDYTFIKWTNSETTNSRTLNVTGNNTPDAIFGMNLFSGTWGLQNNYDFAALGSRSGNDGNGNKIDIDIVKNVNTENSTLIFYFDSNIDDDASFKFYQNYSNDGVQITPTSIKKDGQKLFVNMSNAVNQIQYNGFYMRISGISGTINVKKVCVAPASAMPAN